MAKHKISFRYFLIYKQLYIKIFCFQTVLETFNFYIVLFKKGKQKKDIYYILFKKAVFLFEMTINDESFLKFIDIFQLDSLFKVSN